MAAARPGDPDAVEPPAAAGDGRTARQGAEAHAAEGGDAERHHARQQQQRNTKGFTYDFWEGSEGLSSHWIVRNCKIGSWSMTNDPETGITDKMVSIMGIKAEQIQ